MAVSRTDALLLGVAVAAVSTSAPLTREAAVPALAIAFWRNGFAAAGLAPIAAHRPSSPTANRSTFLLAAGAGVVLAGHFATWIESLSYTSVASSVALVSTQPVWAALLARATGEHIARRAWAGIALALLGVLVAAGVDLSASPRALEGDGLALAGGVLAAVYVSAGAVCRRRMSTTDYTAACYSVAAATVLVGALASGERLTGFPARGWLCIIAITVGPQLLGHSVFNRLLRTVGPTIVSVAVLGEIVGASLLAAWWFGQRPPWGVVPAAGCIAAGVVLVVRGREAAAATSEEVIAG